jgi:type VI secretion system protein ImpI
MALVLTIENAESLPNGAPVSVRLTDKRSLDIGRGAHLDWTLPDPSRFISGKHCEVRYRDEAYWLYDVSTNGTFLNDNVRRLQAPHRLNHGDRLAIGSYVIAVTIEDDQPSAAPSPAAASLTASASEQSASAFKPAPANDLGPDAAAEHAIPEPEFGSADPASQENLQEHSDEAKFETAAAAEAIPASSYFEAATPEISEHPNKDIPSFEMHQPAPDLEPEPAPAQVAELAPADEGADSIADSIMEPAPGPFAIEATAPDPAHPAPEPPQTAAPAGNPELTEFIRRFAAGAGISEQVFMRQDQLKVAEDLGALMRLVVENLTQLLSARYKAKRFARTSSQTMVQAFDNNPLKFAPTAEDALKIMFGPRTRGYLDARRALEGAFGDLKTHQIKTFSAMQRAVKMLVEDLDPDEIGSALGPEKGFAALFGNRKSRLWDMYLARWHAKSLRHEEGLVDAFMLYFAECYDESNDKA